MTRVPRHVLGRTPFSAPRLTTHSALPWQWSSPSTPLRHINRLRPQREHSLQCISKNECRSVCHVPLTSTGTPHRVGGGLPTRWRSPPPLHVCSSVRQMHSSSRSQDAKESLGGRFTAASLYNSGEGSEKMHNVKALRRGDAMYEEYLLNELSSCLRGLTDKENGAPAERKEREMDMQKAEEAVKERNAATRQGREAKVDRGIQAVESFLGGDIYCSHWTHNQHHRRHHGCGASNSEQDYNTANASQRSSTSFSPPPPSASSTRNSSRRKLHSNLSSSCPPGHSRILWRLLHSRFKEVEAWELHERDSRQECVEHYEWNTLHRRGLHDTTAPNTLTIPNNSMTSTTTNNNNSNNNNNRGVPRAMHYRSPPPLTIAALHMLLSNILLHRLHCPARFLFGGDLRELYKADAMMLPERGDAGTCHTISAAGSTAPLPVPAAAAAMLWPPPFANSCSVSSRTDSRGGGRNGVFDFSPLLSFGRSTDGSEIVHHGGGSPSPSPPCSDGGAVLLERRLDCYLSLLATSRLQSITRSLSARFSTEEDRLQQSRRLVLYINAECVCEDVLQAARWSGYRHIRLVPAVVRPSTGNTGMSLEAWQRMVGDDVAAGLLPSIVIASYLFGPHAGLDPIDELAAFCAKAGIWCHLSIGACSGTLGRAAEGWEEKGCPGDGAAGEEADWIRALEREARQKLGAALTVVDSFHIHVGAAAALPSSVFGRFASRRFLPRGEVTLLAFSSIAKLLATMKESKESLCGGLLSSTGGPIVASYKKTNSPRGHGNTQPQAEFVHAKRDDLFVLAAFPAWGSLSSSRIATLSAAALLRSSEEPRGGGEAAEEGGISHVTRQLLLFLSHRIQEDGRLELSRQHALAARLVFRWRLESDESNAMLCRRLQDALCSSSSCAAAMTYVCRIHCGLLSRQRRYWVALGFSGVNGTAKTRRQVQEAKEVEGAASVTSRKTGDADATSFYRQVWSVFKSALDE